MAEFIGCLVAFILVYGIPWMYSRKEESRKRRDMYNGLNKQAQNETDRWRK
mgnify:CR=1 FL=1